MFLCASSCERRFSEPVVVEQCFSVQTVVSGDSLCRQLWALFICAGRLWAVLLCTGDCERCLSVQVVVSGVSLYWQLWAGFLCTGSCERCISVQVIVSCPGLILDVRDGVLPDDPLLFTFWANKQEWRCSNKTNKTTYLLGAGYVYLWDWTAKNLIISFI